MGLNASPPLLPRNNSKLRRSGFGQIFISLPHHPTENTKPPSSPPSPKRSHVRPSVRWTKVGFIILIQLLEFICGERAVGPAVRQTHRICLNIMPDDPSALLQQDASEPSSTKREVIHKWSRKHVCLVLCQCSVTTT